MRKTWGKSGVLGVLLLALLLGLLLAAGPAGAMTRIPFTTVVDAVDDDPRWDEGVHFWTPTGITDHHRDAVAVLWWQSSDPRLTGVSVTTTREVEGHWIYGTKTWQEQQEGTATLSVMRKYGRDPVGVWESSWTAIGTSQYDPPNPEPISGTFVVRGMGRGVSGSVAGLHFEYTVWVTPEGSGILPGSGYIIEP